MCLGTVDALLTECPLLAQSGHRLVRCKCPLLGAKRTWRFALQMSAFDPKRTSPDKCAFSQRFLAHRFVYQRAMAMHADTVAVTNGSAHWGGKCDGCAKISPANVAIELIVTCRASELVVRSICARRATATTAPTVPHIEARSTCSRLNARKTSERVITRKQASQAPANFSAAGRTSPLAPRSANATVPDLALGMDYPLFLCGNASTK
jgi:hypothetical protein